MIQRAMSADAFKVVMVLLFSGLYTNCFCKDESENYLRMLLVRTDVLNYSRSKFLANLIVIITSVILVFFLSAAIYMLIGMPFISDDALDTVMTGVVYDEIVQCCPFLYLLMLALQFGMITAACSSVGILYSTYQPDSFISIGCSGLVFFLVLSASMTVLNQTPFNIMFLLDMSSMSEVLGGNVNPWFAYAWGMMYPLIVIVLCCMKFEKRMKWRAENGIV